ncbi:lytic transglycosylase domain-containing protein [Actibacterium lipolyticum]|uniref:Soluble lytic murein transglycosylase n=1 Tax=Actibacterium lipolyticum TaxID=1524263 RepID=A0A238JLU5_9RHOB|nr:lytic transglycosylase domain-containing protein [Actibacterium lipolyticum]SMX30756.1 Soluble lytic murein transglycosylase precursor [Actibacterium lipolyticum]
MRSFFLTVLTFVLLAHPIAARAEPALSLVMKAVRADEWEAARTIARPEGRVVQDIVEWRYLRAGEGEFDQYVDFLKRNPDWPGLDRMRARGEVDIPASAKPDAVLDYFADYAPATGIGGLRLANAYKALGRNGDAEAQAVLTWRSMLLTPAVHAAFLNEFGDMLEPHHLARLDAMLWQGEAASAQLMLPLVPEEWGPLSSARIALRRQSAGVDQMIEAIPANLTNDAGLAYERFVWRARKGRDEDAMALLDERSISSAALGQPTRWASRRRTLARQAMRAGDAELAYRLAANHFLSEGSDFADLEWLAGFIALRMLKEPEVALSHFRRFEAAVETPISLGRAGYWEGRALEELGRTEDAQAAFAKGGQHQTGFYGQLAAERAGMAMDAGLIGAETYPDWTTAPFAGSSALKAALLFVQAGERNLAELFLTHLAETAGAHGQAQLAGLALSLNEEHIALRIAKVAAGQGNVMPRAYFPVTNLGDAEHPVPTELVLSIARRESEFDPVVVSGAGARGLMQLMPGTAQEVAGKLDVAYSSTALLTDPSYNARLGAAYLAGLIEEFGDNYVLVSAGYNAGPSRPRRWIGERGDPRSAGVDVIDWIEMIPFRETRNYVMRVTESVPIYRARLTGKTTPWRLSKELQTQ